MKDRYRIHTEYNFGVVKLEPGVKSFEDLYELAKIFREDKNFVLVKYLLIDMRDCIFKFGLDKIHELISLMKKYEEVDNQELGVYIVNQPIETAYVQLFFERIKDNRKFCLTEEKAFRILKLPMSFSDFLNIIDI